MSDTRNHTTRDQLAAALEAHTVEDYSEGELYGDDSSLLCACGFVAYGSDLYDAGHNHRAHITDALLASDAIAAVRAAAVAETTAAIEAVLPDDKPCYCPECEDNPDQYRDETAMAVRAALSGGRTALCSHPHWEEEGDESGSHGVWVCTTCGEASSVTESAEEQPR